MAAYLNVGYAIMVCVFLSPFFRFAKLCSCANLTLTSCKEEEKQVLLKFKDSFFNGMLSYERQFASWKGDNCCKWKGIECDGSTGHVVKIDLRHECYSCMLQAGTVASSLVELKHLNHLDLSGHYFNDTQIPSFFGSMKHLKYLNLSYSGFFGRIPHQLGNFTNLQFLDLSYNYIGQLYTDDLSWISQLSSLQYIDLSGVPISNAMGLIMQVISELPSLLQVHFEFCAIENPSVPHIFTNSTFPTKVQVLNLKHNYLFGPIPIALRNMTSIRVLDLSRNFLSENIPIWLAEFRNLVQLHLANNYLSGPIPITLQNMSAIKVLNLSTNRLTSSAWNFRNNCNIQSFGTLKNIENLDLSGNKFAEIIPSCFGELKSLTYLSLVSNKFYGPIPQSFGNLTNLRELWLGNNQLNGTIPASLLRLSNLWVLDLGSNHLTGIIPDGLGGFYNLYALDLSKNSLEGTIHEIHLGNLSNLQDLRIGFNNFGMKLKPNWLPPFQLENLDLHSCRIKSSFPQWLQTQDQLIKLDLSNTSIEGTIPKWFQQMDLIELDLSNNQFSGSIPVDLHDRMPKLNALLLGNNLLNGSIPNGLCKLEELYNLDVSKNKLSGKIPHCLLQMDSLELINLSSNKLLGTIPNSNCSSFSILESLNLSNNSLHGEFPINLGSCTLLTILDVGDNQIFGPIPPWIGKALYSLKILRLRGNIFNGSIPLSLCQLKIMQVLDLAQNNLVGSIPHCIGQLQAMMLDQDLYIYEKNATLAPTSLSPKVFPNFGQWDKEHVNQLIKGREYEYTRNLEFMFNIDLSNNKLTGYIPEGLTALSKLVNLNLSHNHLFGTIPSNIGNMKSLESVDFSYNTLSGPIPDSMPLITTLSHLNLSYNNFSGPIPIKNQFSTFECDPSIYVGNPYLYRIPLQNKCSGDEARQPISSIGFEDKHAKEDVREKMLFYFVIAVGYVSGFWGVIGVLLLKKNWRHACFGYVEKVADSIYVAVAVRVARLKRAMEVGEK